MLYFTFCASQPTGLKSISSQAWNLLFDFYQTSAVIYISPHILALSALYFIGRQESALPSPTSVDIESPKKVEGSLELGNVQGTKPKEFDCVLPCFPSIICDILEEMKDEVQGKTHFTMQLKAVVKPPSSRLNKAPPFQV
jgi:hypothetical protein